MALTSWASDAYATYMNPTYHDDDLLPELQSDHDSEFEESDNENWSPSYLGHPSTPLAETHPPDPVMLFQEHRPEALAVPAHMVPPPAPILARVASKLLACLPSGRPPLQSQPLDCPTLRRPLARVGFIGARPVILNGLKFPCDPGGLYSLGAHSRPAPPPPRSQDG